ncbi:hypothetical protein [Aminipila terrae]|uniref:DUF3953 domain-containing protein n=1 Tax=Aminipila terrae TaxID=2697030 RepID=A0A6P1MR39_9FIRM|nr:hypothetical protein [Aminipila terrae]QHI73465.1 hypothetical protein Ami3637_14730 [Aminipila terrae]
MKEKVLGDEDMKEKSFIIVGVIGITMFIVGFTSYSKLHTIMCTFGEILFGLSLLMLGKKVKNKKLALFIRIFSWFIIFVSVLMLVCYMFLFNKLR